MGGRKEKKKGERKRDTASDLSEPVQNAPLAICLTEKLGAIIVRLYIYPVKNNCMQTTFSEKLPCISLNVLNERVCYFNRCSVFAMLHPRKVVHLKRCFFLFLFGRCLQDPHPGTATIPAWVTSMHLLKMTLESAISPLSWSRPHRLPGMVVPGCVFSP